MDIYKFFNVNKNATKEEIKKAYRKKAKKTHPDKNSSKREEFEKANMFYMVLMDEAKRKQYDETGVIDGNKKDHNIPMNIICSTFNQVLLAIKTEEIETIDLVQKIKNIILGKISENEKNILNMKNSINNIDKILKRLKCKSDINVFKNILEEKIKNYELNIYNIDKENKYNEEAIKLLDDYSYDYELYEYINFVGDDRTTTANSADVFR